jgi:hypothetical protein
VQDASGTAQTSVSNPPTTPAIPYEAEWIYYYCEELHPVKFIVDVDNLSAIVGISRFFQGYDVILMFFVKNQVNLSLPSFDEFHIPFDIVIVEKNDDDDLSALTEALNSDSFILSCDKYRTYLNSGLVT